ncbi:MAG: carboxypeptidase regulatory-like domain-containing protein [Gemmatimonadetes bacterium]|nr:carboxypeptidase regulatory-like domain-containing protein [Gemmatimonadota bacterium]
MLTTCVAHSLRLAAVALLTVASARTGSAQGRTETVSGVARADSTTPVAGAKVLVQMAPDRATDSTLTDADGRWSLQFAEATGDYLVRITRNDRGRSPPTTMAAARAATRTRSPRG